MLVASCCLADPLYAPLCSFVDMAPSSVGHCQFCNSAEVRFVQFSVKLGRLTHQTTKLSSKVLSDTQKQLCCRNGWVTFPVSLLAVCSRKASLKDKVFPSPSKAPFAKGKAQSPGAEDGGEGSPYKVAKSWSFTEKNRGAKTSLKSRGSTSRQNSEGKEGAHSSISIDDYIIKRNKKI